MSVSRACFCKECAERVCSCVTSCSLLLTAGHLIGTWIHTSQPTVCTVDKFRLDYDPAVVVSDMLSSTVRRSSATTTCSTTTSLVERYEFNSLFHVVVIIITVTFY